MELIEVFQILGIEQTKDERALKNAYRDRLTVKNPEDDPEGFKRLRAAYEEACRYARTPDAQESEETEQTLEDETPAGQWVREVRKIYENITDRCDERKWKALFEADAFLSLEEEENCTVYLLRFLMEHFKLPTDIWKLLDEKIHIVQNAGSLRERFPAQFVSYMVHKCEAGEEVDFSEQEKEALERLEAQMQGHPGMGLQAIWHRYHSAQEQEGTGQKTKDTDPAVAAFHKEKPQSEKRGFWQRLFGKKQ